MALSRSCFHPSSYPEFVFHLLARNRYNKCLVYYYKCRRCCCCLFFFASNINVFFHVSKTRRINELYNYKACGSVFRVCFVFVVVVVLCCLCENLEQVLVVQVAAEELVARDRLAVAAVVEEVVDEVARARTIAAVELEYGAEQACHLLAVDEAVAVAVAELEEQLELALHARRHQPRHGEHEVDEVDLSLTVDVDEVEYHVAEAVHFAVLVHLAKALLQYLLVQLATRTVVLDLVNTHV